MFVAVPENGFAALFGTQAKIRKVGGHLFL
jgi:hypothetical protein